MRMSIKALTLADIATVDGKYIASQSWNLIHSNNLREKYKWPRKPQKFQDHQIEIWRNALRQTFCEQHPRNLKIRYLFTLGKWTEESIIDS